MAFASGPYRWFFNGNPLGVVASAPEVEISPQFEDINADFAGGQAVDAIFQGAPVSIDLVFQEFNRNAINGTGGVLSQLTGVNGGFGSNQSSLIERIGCPISQLNGVTLRGAAVNIVNNCTVPVHFVSRRAVVSADTPIRLLYGSRLRNVPIRFKLYPYEYRVNTDNYHHFEEYTQAQFDTENSFAAVDTRTSCNSILDALNA